MGRHNNHKHNHNRYRHRRLGVLSTTSLKSKSKSSWLIWIMWILLFMVLLLATVSIIFSLFFIGRINNDSNDRQVDYFAYPPPTKQTANTYTNTNANANANANATAVSMTSDDDKEENKQKNQEDNNVNSSIIDGTKHKNTITTTTTTTTTSRIIRRYDDAGPKGIPGTARSHALPNAVPYLTRQIPLGQVTNKTYHILQRTNTSKPLSKYPDPKKKTSKYYHLNNSTIHGKYNWNHNYTTDYRTLYLYNPSILPLHNTIVENENDHNNNNYEYDILSPEELLDVTGGDTNVRYVVIYRAYLGNNCFGPGDQTTKKGREMMTVGEQISYLAIALLDETLDVIPESDTLIDLNAGPARGLYFRQFIEDCRIFCLNKSIYLLCNEEIMRIHIKRRTINNNINTTSTKIPTGSYGTKDNLRIPYVYPNIHGNGLQVTLIGQNTQVSGGKNFNIFRSLQQTSTMEMDGNKTNEGKKSQSSKSSKTRINENGNENGNVYDYYLQTYPIPHKYRKLNIPMGGLHHQTTPIRKTHNDDIRLDILKDTNNNNKHSVEHEAPPILLNNVLEGQSPRHIRPTFDTPDSNYNISICKGKKDNDGWIKNCTTPVERSFFDNNKDHGTACCVKVMLPSSSLLVPTTTRDHQQQRHHHQEDVEVEVMVGISHQKLSLKDRFWLKDTKNRYVGFGIDRFVSRFVAYETIFPFRIVAISGWFCLGFSSQINEGPQQQQRRNDNNNHNDNHFDNTKSTFAGLLKNTNNNNNTTTTININTQLDLFNVTYNCPIIHFISGFSEVVGNSSQAIIGYGINDCHPRMFKIEKQEIRQLLTSVDGS